MDAAAVPVVHMALIVTEEAAEAVAVNLVMIAVIVVLMKIQDHSILVMDSQLFIMILHSPQSTVFR